MYPGSPIPEYAKFEDPLWTSRFLDLANAMVLMGAKPKLIARYTGLSSKAIAERYKRLTGQEAPAGRLQQTQPRHYALPHNRGGLDWNLQAATFSSIYLKIEKALDEPANRGWLLLTAYQAYYRLTDAMQQAYVPYRVALFKTGNGTQEEALNSVQQAQQTWKKSNRSPAPA